MVKVEVIDGIVYQLEEPVTSSFVWADYLVFAIVLLISLGIGVFYAIIGRKSQSTAEFLMASRSMGTLPVALSLLASFMSAITLLGTPAEMYMYGTEYWLIWLGYLLLIPMAVHIYIPIFYKLKLTSVFEYLEMRFNRPCRMIGAMCFIVQMILYMAIVLYTPSLALNVVTGLDKWISVFVVGIVCTFYTTIGGIKAVMWTDAFQIVMMFAGLIAVLIKGSIDLGGFGNIWAIMEERQRTDFWNPDPDPTVRHTFWSLSIGGCFTWLAIYGCNQAMVQRALTTPTLRQGQLALYVNLPGLTALLTICCLCGCVVFAEYKDCDPIGQKRIEGKDQLLPLYVMDKLSYPGLPGLFTSCLFSGALSTISSGLNSLAAVTLQDFVKLACFPELSEERSTLATKIIAVCFGALMIALTFVAANLGGVLQAALGLFGMIGGPVLGVFTLGIIYPWANAKGAVAGLLTSLILTLWMGIGGTVLKAPVPKAPLSMRGCFNGTSNFTTTMPPYTTDFGENMYTTAAPEVDDGSLLDNFYKVSYIWYASFAMIVCNVVGLVVSFATGPTNPKDLDPRLFCPIFDIFCCYLPYGVREKLRCHIDTDNAFTDEDAGIIKKDKPIPTTGHYGDNAYVNPAMDQYMNGNGKINEETLDTKI